jgi:hypothetical protein
LPFWYSTTLVGSATTCPPGGLRPLDLNLVVPEGDLCCCVKVTNLCTLAHSVAHVADRRDLYQAKGEPMALPYRSERGWLRHSWLELPGENVLGLEKSDPRGRYPRRVHDDRRLIASSHP